MSRSIDSAAPISVSQKRNFGAFESHKTSMGYWHRLLFVSFIGLPSVLQLKTETGGFDDPECDQDLELDTFRHCNLSVWERYFVAN